jgi:hypothetical protein
MYYPINRDVKSEAFMANIKPHPEAEKKFRPFAESMMEANRQNIHSIHLTGSVLTPDYDPKRSNINSIVVFHQMDVKHLAVLAPLGKKHGKKGIAAPLIMTPDYIHQSLDVFPIEFLNIHLLHHTWTGEDIFEPILIEPSDLRRQCERELKVRLVGLRQNYISAVGNRKTLSESFINAFSGYIPLFRGIIMLYQIEPPLTNSEVLSVMEDTTGIAIDAFKAVWKLKQERSKPTLQQLNTFFEDCYAAIENLGNAINALEV